MDGKEESKKTSFLDKESQESIDNRSQHKQTQKKQGLIYRLFGCCLDRESISRHITEEDSETNKIGDNEEAQTQYQEAKVSLQKPPQLQFNSQQNSQSAKPSIKDKSQKQEHLGINGEINTYSANSFSSGVPGSLSDLRNSSLSEKTHNYDFDVSNYQLNQLFLCGKLLQVIALVKEVNHSIDYSKFKLPDEFSGTSEDCSMSSSSTSQSCSSYQFHPDTIKFYRRRLVYFSQYQKGVSVGHKFWQYLIPEQIVMHIAKRAASSSRRESIIDTSSGTGQFAIAFASLISQVISIETDPQRITYIKHNATTYGIPHSTYNQQGRLAQNEGILYYQEQNFLSDGFQINSNFSDCVFIVPSFWPENLDQSPSLSPSYYASNEFYMKLKQYLKKSFKLAPQVIILLPRTVKIVEICDCFADSLKENQNTVKRCSVEIEKHFINNHLKYVCFYLGDFNRTQLSFQDEYSFINLQLEKCQGPAKQMQSIHRKVIHIHQSVFNELGKFQILNIVCKFSYQVKIDKPLTLREDKSLLSLFYAYLVSHQFLNQARVQYILSRWRNSNSNISSNTPHNFNAVFEERADLNDEMIAKEYQSGMSSYSDQKSNFMKKLDNNQSPNIEDRTLSEISRVTFENEGKRKRRRTRRNTFQEDQVLRSKSEGDDQEEEKKLQDEEEEKLYSETETESVYEYEDDSSFSKHQLNISQNTNQISFLKVQQRNLESKIDESGVRQFGGKKSHLSNYSQQAGADQEQMIIFNQQFFEQNRPIPFTLYNISNSQNNNNSSEFLNFSEYKDLRDKQTLSNLRQQPRNNSSYANHYQISSRNQSNSRTSRIENYQIFSRNNSNQLNTKNNLSIAQSSSNAPSRTESNLTNGGNSILPNFSLQTHQEKMIESQ